jgi:hypothetical protein
MASGCTERKKPVNFRERARLPHQARHLHEEINDLDLQWIEGRPLLMPVIDILRFFFIQGQEHGAKIALGLICSIKNEQFVPAPSLFWPCGAGRACCKSAAVQQTGSGLEYLFI